MSIGFGGAELDMGDRGEEKIRENRRQKVYIGRGVDNSISINGARAGHGDWTIEILADHEPRLISACPIYCTLASILLSFELIVTVHT